MARSRNLKPGFFKNEELAAISPLARLAFAGLWTLADREGRLEDRPKRLKVEVLPYDAVDMETLLAEIAAAGFIRRYEANGYRFLDIPTFLKHQNPHTKEPKSEIPQFQDTPKKPRKNTAKPVQVSERTISTRPLPSYPLPLSPIPYPSISPSGSGGPPLTAQAIFVEAFGKLYREKTGQPYNAQKADFVIAANLIKAHGLETCIAKVGVLGVLCERKSAWFTDAGFAAFTIGKLSNRWNEIIPESHRPSQEDEEKAALKRVEEQRERANSLLGRR